MCLAAESEGKQPIEMCFFKRKRGKHFFYKSYKKTWLDHDKSFCLSQQVALISTDDPIKCPIFGESFASIETKLFWKVRNRFVWEIMTTWMLEVDLQNSQFKNTSHVLRGDPGMGGHGGTKKAHIARIGQKVAYFERCLIVISKDKITSYHIWKIFLQSFSHELLVANGDDDDGDYNMKTCRERNLRVCGKAHVVFEVEIEDDCQIYE